jgi:hypothetical protein
VKDIKVGVEKMTRNRRKMIEKTADSLLLSKHSIQFSALFLLLSGPKLQNLGKFKSSVNLIENNEKYLPSWQICRTTGLHCTADLGLHVTLWVLIGFKTWLQLLQ